MNIKSTGIAFAGLFMCSASAIVVAETVSFEISATVYNISDPGNGLQGSITIGDQITGTYTYDTSTPDNDPYPEFGHYTFNTSAPTTPQQGFDLMLNNHNLKSDPNVPGHMFEAFVMNGYTDHFGLSSWGNTPLANGTEVGDINLDLYDPTGQALNSSELSNLAPNVSAFEMHDLRFSGSTMNYDYYSVEAKIDFIKVVGGGACLPENINPVTFNVTATVRELYDYDNVIGSEINIGDTVTGSYTFNTDAPDVDPDPNHGMYEHFPGNGDFGFNLSIANYNLKTDPNTGSFNISLNNSQDWLDSYSASHWGSLLPFVNGSVVDSMSVYLDDPTGSMVTSTALSDQPPSLNLASVRELMISGSRTEPTWTYTAFYTIVADIKSLTPANNCQQDELVEVSPGSGIFDRQQKFDVAIILEPNLPPPASMQATLNGFDINYELINRCHPGSMNNQNRQTIVCPGLSDILMTGNNFLTFSFSHEDGRTSNHTIDWFILGDWY